MFGLTQSKDAAPVTRPRQREFGAWDPWAELDRVRTEIDPFFRAFFGPTRRQIAGSGTVTPPVDLYETAEELVLRAYLPGISREDVHLEVVGDTIHLWGESKAVVPEKEFTVHLTGGYHGSFDLRYTLTVEVQSERCMATYRGGILEVHLPKVETARPRRVPIQVEG
jgi:HSP20 family protein